MNKCEHGQKINMFCASDCCVWKEAAGCDSCIKKYHNHMGPTIFLNQQQIIALVKKYAMDSNIKPKCRILQEAIFSYFTLIKTELTNSMDIICKNIINQIGYPYLYSNNTLSTYKRLKNKEYKKLVQKEFKVLYELSQKIGEKQLAKQEAKIYMNEMKHTQELLNNLEDMVKRYETIAKTSQPSFTHDSSYILKINQVIQTLRLDSQSPKISKIKESKEPREHSGSQKHSIQTNNFVKQKQEPSKFQQKQKQSEVVYARQNTIGAPPVLAKDKHRQVSIDKKILKEHKFVKPSKEKGEEKFPGIVESKVQSINQQLNAKQLQLNERKKLLIDMMKQKEDNNKIQKQKAKTQASQVQKYEFDITKNKTFAERLKQINRQLYESEISTFSKENSSKLSKEEEKSNISSQNPFLIRLNTIQNSETQQNNEEYEEGKKEDEQETHQAFTNLPIVEKVARISEEVREVKKKMIVIPKPEKLNEIQNNQSMLGQSQSPILKRINLQTQNKLKESMVNLKQETQQIKQDPEIFKKINFTFSKYNQILQLKENQEKSLALLLKSLTLNAEQAINHLEKSLEHADNNLSAAEYLSYLYLQLNQPQNCLYLCNTMIEKIQNSADPEELSLIINNNKAAALNVLGRYSESIMILQKCLKCREKDYFYKNLGDAYFSVSIYQKAIYNYEKALRMNECFDEAQYNLAVCLFIQQNYFNAKLSIKKALEQQPTNEDYLELLHNIQIRINHC